MSLNCQLKEFIFIFWSAWPQTLPNYSVSMYIFVSLTLYPSFFNMLFYWCESESLFSISSFVHIIFIQMVLPYSHRLTMSRYIMWLNSLSSYICIYIPTYIQPYILTHDRWKHGTICEDTLPSLSIQQQNNKVSALKFLLQNT